MAGGVAAGADDTGRTTRQIGRPTATATAAAGIRDSEAVRSDHIFDWYTTQNFYSSRRSAAMSPASAASSCPSFSVSPRTSVLSVVSCVEGGNNIT